MPKGKKRKAANPICPCCNQEQNRTDMSLSIGLMQKIEKINHPNLDKDFVADINNFVGADFAWACDSCLRTKKAQLANPSAQNYCWEPYYAYYDTTHSCRKCQTDFVFSAKEKRFWFESLKFWIDSEPVNCLNCRKEERTLKSQNTILSNILKKPEEDISNSELEQVISIYDEWGKIERSKYYQSILNKRKKLQS